jgi:acetoacetyl-CoA synthetase
MDLEIERLAGEVEVLWRPTLALIEATQLAAYQRRLARVRGLRFDDYAALWQWSVSGFATFWQTVWDFFDAQAESSCEPVLASHTMPGASWYPNARLNCAEPVFRHARVNQPALIASSEDTPTRKLSWVELQRDTGALALRMRALGIVAGDRVA